MTQKLKLKKGQRTYHNNQHLKLAKFNSHIAYYIELTNLQNISYSTVRWVKNSCNKMITIQLEQITNQAVYLKKL